mgnify:CR=1 FL=1
MTKEKIKLIKYAKAIMAYCKDHTNTCKDCPFYMMDNDEWTGCTLEANVPEGWEIKEYEQNRH